MAHVRHELALGPARRFRGFLGRAELRGCPGVLQSEGRLIGERLGHADLVGLEAAALRTPDGEGADRLISEHDRHGEHAPASPPRWRRARTSSVIGIRGSFRTSSDITGRRSRTATPEAPVPRGSRTPTCQPGPRDPDSGEGHQVARRTVGAVQGGDAGVEEPADTLDDSFRDLVRVERLRDDAADLGEALGGSPSALGFLEEAGVLDRDTGLIGQVGREREHVIVECMAELSVDVEGAQDPMPDAHRDRHLGTDPRVPSPRPVLGQEPRVRRAVGGDDRLAGGGNPAADRLPQADPLRRRGFLGPGRHRHPDEKLAVHQPEAGLSVKQLRGGLGDSPQHRMEVQATRDALGDGDQRPEISAPGL